MGSSNLPIAAFSGYDLSSSASPTKTSSCQSNQNAAHEATRVSRKPPFHSRRSGSDPDSWFSFSSRHTVSDSGVMAAPFEVPKLWREAMQCVSINANLYPQQILHKYYDFFPTQAALHPGYVELDIWRSKRATERGVKLVQICYLDDDPSKIHLMVIFIDALDPNTKRSIIRLVTNTSLHHVLEEPCANCPLWLKVHSDVGPHADSPYQIIPCCDQWVDNVDFEGPISSEEKQVPAVVVRLVEEVKKKNLLLHAKEREIEAKDDQLRRLRGQDRPDTDIDVGAAPTVRRYPQGLQNIDMGTLEQHWWVAAIMAIVLVVFALK